MNTNNRPVGPARALAALLAALVLAAALAVAPGCALVDSTPDKSEQARPALSRNAALIYSYFEYQEYMKRLASLTRGKEMSKETLEQALTYQQRAALALDVILANDPSPMIYLQKANLYWNRQQIGTAKSILMAGLEKFPKDWNLTSTLAAAYLFENRPKDAVYTLEKYLGHVPEDLAARKKLAEICIEVKLYARALDVLKAVPQDKRDAEVLYLMSRAQARLGFRRQGIESLKKAVKLDPDYMEAWAEMAYLYELEKDYVAAEKTYARMLKMGSESPEVRLRLIEINLKLNNPDKALKLALEYEDAEPSFLLKAANEFIDAQFFGQASTVLDVLSSDGPMPPEAYFYKALIAFEGEKDPAKALNWLEQIPRDYPHYDRIYHFKAHMLFTMGKNAEALELLGTAKQQYVNHRDLLLLEATIYESMGELDKARQELGKALEIWPQDEDLLFQMGILQDKMEDQAGAMRTMERIIAMDPDNADALNYVGYTLAERGEDLDRALVLVSTALKQKPGNGYIIDSLAWVYYKLGRLNMAWDEIRRAVVNVKSDPVIWEHYGDIARALGKKKSARKGYLNSIKFEAKDKDRLKRKLEEL